MSDLPGGLCIIEICYAYLALRPWLASGESSSGIFKKECVFCKKIRKRQSKLYGSSYEYLSSCETLDGEYNIQEAECEITEMDVVKTDMELVAKEVMYRNTCKNAYIKKAHWVWEDQTNTP